MVAVASKTLFWLIEKDFCPEKHVVIPSEVIMRDSTCALRVQKQT